MPDLYQKQSYSLILDTNIALGSPVTSQIKWRSPKKRTGQWNATVQNSTELQYNVTHNDNNEAGDWTFWAFVQLSTGRQYYGNSVVQRVLREGRVPV